MNYNFKVKVSDYKKVIALVDTDIKGKLFSAGSHFITFDRKALPKEKIKLWFIPPETGNGETVTGRDNFCFDLGNLKSMKVSAKRPKEDITTMRKTRLFIFLWRGIKAMP